MAVDDLELKVNMMLIKKLSEYWDDIMDMAKNVLIQELYQGNHPHIWASSIMEEYEKKVYNYVYGYRMEQLILDPFGDDPNNYLQQRQWAIEKGTGSQGDSDGPNASGLHTKPGETVWDEILSGKKTSEATSIHPVPEIEGNNYIENAIKTVESILADYIPRIIGEITIDDLLDCLS